MKVLAHSGALPGLGLLLVLAAARAQGAPALAPLYDGLPGEVLLDNERVLVEKFVIAPGQWTGRFHPRGDQLAVFIKGGVLRSRTNGRGVLWRDGRVAWHAAGSPGDDGSINAGAAPIVLEWVTVKPVTSAAGTAGQPPKYQYLNYPNIPGEDLLENDWVIVQRFIVQPGQWEGVHAHHPDMLYIHVKGGQWAGRSRSEPEHRYPQRDEDGAVGWMTPIPLSAGHESGNAGDEPIDLIWVTLKK